MDRRVILEREAMKKTVIVCVVIVALVAALGYVVNEYVLTDSDLRATKQRIKQYRIVAEEQSLIRQILEDKILVARIQAQIAPPAPVPATPE